MGGKGSGRKRKSEKEIIDSIHKDLKELKQLTKIVVSKQEEYFGISDKLDKRIASLNQRIIYYLKTRREHVTTD